MIVSGSCLEGLFGAHWLPFVSLPMWRIKTRYKSNPFLSWTIYFSAFFPPLRHCKRNAWWNTMEYCGIMYTSSRQCKKGYTELTLYIYTVSNQHVAAREKNPSRYEHLHNEAARPPAAGQWNENPAVGCEPEKNWRFCDPSFNSLGANADTTLRHRAGMAG